MMGTKTLLRKLMGSKEPILMAPLGKRRNNSYYRLLEFWAFLLLIWHYKKSKINKCNQKSINMIFAVFSFINQGILIDSTLMLIISKSWKLAIQEYKVGSNFKTCGRIELEKYYL